MFSAMSFLLMAAAACCKLCIECFITNVSNLRVLRTVAIGRYIEACLLQKDSNDS